MFPPRKVCLTYLVFGLVTSASIYFNLTHNIRLTHYVAPKRNVSFYLNVMRTEEPVIRSTSASNRNISTGNNVTELVNNSTNDEPDTWLTRTHWKPEVDRHLYSTLINPKEKCVFSKNASASSRNLTLLILVKSAPGHSKLRDAIRSTYIQGAVKHNVSCRTFFLLGYPGHDDKKQAEIVKEAETHGDIIQEDFVDSYYNLTTKIIMGFKWATTFCNNSQFVMSADDDVMIDIVTLVHDLSNASQKHRSEFVLGQPTYNVGPFRSPKSKWYTPKSLYPSNKYPTYPQGHGYTISQDIVSRIYHLSQEFPPPVPWDDVYFGALLKKLGIQITSRKPWYKARHNVTRPANPLIPFNDYVIIQLSVDKMHKVWEAMDGEVKN